jgi:hypothetical protein
MKRTALYALVIITVFLLLVAPFLAGAQQSVLRARNYPYSSSSGFVPVSYDSSGFALIFRMPLSSLGGSGSGTTFTGTTAQYVRGDGSYATFPTNVSSFTNNAGYLTTTTGDARYALLSHSHVISDVTGLQTALNGKQATITTGTTAQYLRGDLSLATFPTAISTFTNDAGYLTTTTGDARYPLLSHTHAISDVTGLQTSLNGKQATITTGTTLQYLRGDLSLATFPTALSAFTNDPGFLTANQSITLSGDLSGSGATSISATVNSIKSKAVPTLAAGFLKYSGTAWTFDNSTYLTGNQSISLSGDLSGSGATSISGTVNGLKGVALPALATGFLKYNGTSWVFDNSTYLTTNQSISFAPTGDVTGTTSGTTSLAPALTIGARKVLYSMMPSVTDARLLGRSAGSAGDAMEITIGSGLSLSAGTLSATGGGTGTVTGVSITSANGFAGSSNGNAATPALTLSTTVNGMLKGNSTSISAASAGTDYTAGTGSLATGILKNTTSSGTLSIAVAADFPTLNQNTTGTAGNITGVLNASSFPALTGDVTTSSGSVATTIGANTVSYSKFQQVAASSLVGNPTGSTANAQGITLAGNLAFSGTTITTLDKQNSLLSNATTTATTNTNTNLSFSAAANELWVLELNWTAQCSSTGGSKFQITAPTGSTVEGWYQGTTAAVTTLTNQRITAINTLTATAAHTVATTPAPDRICVRVKVGATPGTIALGFASVTAAQTTTIFAGASMRAFKVTEL